MNKLAMLQSYAGSMPTAIADQAQSRYVQHSTMRIPITTRFMCNFLLGAALLLVTASVSLRFASLQSASQINDNAKVETSQVEILPPAPRSVVFWSSDLHDGTRAAMSSLLSRLGMKIVLAGVKGSKNPYPIFSMPGVSMPLRQLPLVMHRNLSSIHSYLSEVDARSLFDYYKSDAEVRSVDAFICSFQLSLCEAWMPFNKTLVLIAGHRYALGRCSRERWNRLTEHIQAMHAKGHVIASLTQYDVEYIRYFTGIRPVLVPFSCLDYTKLEASRNLTIQDEILVGPLQTVALHPVFNELTANTSGRWRFATAKAKYGFFSLQQVASHRAVVMLPYALSSFGISELYSLNMPLFVPSLEFLYELHKTGHYNVMTDYRVQSSVYCGNETLAPPPHPENIHPVSPEEDSERAFKYWLKWADFYAVYKHVITFHSWSDLIVQLESVNFDALRAKQKMHNQHLHQRERIFWSSIPKLGGTIPLSYEQALRDIWGVSRLQFD